MIPFALLLMVTALVEEPGPEQAPLPHQNNAELVPILTELRQARVDPGPEGVREYLDSLRLTPTQETRVLGLLEELSHPDFRVRERATHELLAYRYLPPRLLRQASQKDPETADRVNRVIREGGHRSYARLSYPVLQLIADRPIRGMASRLLDLIPDWPDSIQSDVALRAIAATALVSDVPRLRQALSETQPETVRIAAVRGLSGVLGTRADRDLESLLTDRNSRVALAVATTLIERGNRQALTTLIRLLDNQKEEVRYAAASLLHVVTGRTEEHDTDSAPERRARAISAWRDWNRREGARVTLILPSGNRPVWRGRVLICVFGPRQLREVDLVTEKTTLEVHGFTYPWGCSVTSTGHRLAVDYVNKQIFEYDLAGKVCWRAIAPGRPTGVQRLPNGRTLVPLPEDGLVVELDHAGKVVWEIRLNNRPTTAIRLPDGRTLISLQDAGKVVEVDRAGKELWQINGFGRPHTVQRLANGNTLVTEFGGKVSEVDRSGKVVWYVAGLHNPAQAQRLPNGHTLISSNDGLIEYDHNGRKLRVLDPTRSRFFAY